MNEYALIGHLLGHSMSPLIHEKLFALSGMTFCSYRLIDIPPEELSSCRELFESLDGMNVTIPHKQSVIPLMDELGDSARRYNSVNCVKNDGKKLIGYNTDCGGVGRMMAVETVRHGGKLTLAVIPQDMVSAQRLMAEILSGYPGASVKITDIASLDEKFDLMVNATPVGMFPKTDACAVSDKAIENCLSFFDAIYNPTETLLMKKARAMGKTAVGGASMLVYQAVSAHEIWYGGTFSPEDISLIIKDVEKAVDEMNQK